MVSPAFRTITKFILVNSVTCVFGVLVLSVLSLGASPVQAAQLPKPNTPLAVPFLPHNLQPSTNSPILESSAAVMPDARLVEPSKSNHDRDRHASTSYTKDGNLIASNASSLISGTLSQDWGDFDRDGFLDLALGTSSGISVYHNLAGQLTNPAWSLPGDPAFGVRWADLNDDGHLELIAVGGASTGGAVRNPIFRFDGSGFTQTEVFTSDYPLARVIVLPGSPLDLIASTAAISVPCPVLRFSNNGHGQFTTPATCVSTSATAAIGTADVDNDGYPDLVMGRFPNRLVLLKNQAGVLTDTNGATVFDTSPFWPYDFAWGDYDGDGYLDLAAAFPLQRQVRIYHNEAPAANLPFKLASLMVTQRFMTPLAIDWGDFNGDGELDLAVADDPPQVTFNVNQAIKPGTARLLLSNSPAHANMWSARAVALDNRNLSLSLSAQSGPGLLYQTMAGHLQPQITPIAGAIAANGAAWADANGDGQIDLLLGAVSSTGQSTVYWNANGTFSNTSSNVFPFDGAQSIVIGDLGKRDGRLEAVVGTSTGNIRVYTLTNTAPIQASAWGTGMPLNAIALGDLNNDGWLDLLAGTADGTILVHANSRGNLSSVPVFTAHKSGQVRSVAWADYNSDLYMDFAVATDPGSVQVYRNNQDKSFTPVFTFTESTHNTAVAWSDFNGDGTLDLAVGTDGQGVKLYENHGSQLSEQSIWTSTFLSHTTSLAWGDWNNDSHPDLAVGNEDGPVQVFANLDSQPGSPQFALTWSSHEGGGTTGVAWGDANHDGYLDLAVSRRTGLSGVYHNTSVLPWRLPNPPSYLSLARPGKTLDAYLYSSSELLPGYFDALPLTIAPTLTVYYTAYHSAGMPITNPLFEFSLDGGSNWSTASYTVSSPPPPAITQTAPLGQGGVFIWDTQADKAISDNALFRVRIVDQASTGPVQRAAAAAVSPPFRVRGLSCMWSAGLSIDYTPKTNPIAPLATLRFIGVLAESSGDVMTYTWDFGDGTTGNGKEVTHAFDQVGFYTVRLTATSATCPTPQPLRATQIIQVGNPPRYWLYLPIVQRQSTAAKVLEANQTLADTTVPIAVPSPVVQRLAVPAASNSTCLTIPIASLTSPTVPWITTTKGYLGQPVLNSDGTRLAFWSTADLVGTNPDGNVELFYGNVDLVGSCITVNQITDSTGGILEGFNLGPSINAAGDRIAFFSDRDLVSGGNTDHNFEIFLARITPTGIALTQITSTTDRVNAFPSLDAAGTHLAFASDQNLGGAPANADGNQEIFVATLDAAGQTVLSFTQITDTEIGTFNDEPAISTDGQSIAFVRGGNLPASGIQEIFVTTLGQSTATRVTTSTLDFINYHPTIGSGGTRIAFASATITQGTINLATLSGSSIDSRPLSALTLGDQPALNSSDGSRIAAISDHQQVKVLNPGASSVIPVFPCSNATCDSPAISSDGMHVAFLSGSTLYVAYYETANLSITLASATAPAVAGTSVTYTFSIVNQGPSPADSVEITGSLLASPGVTLTAVSTTYPSGACSLLAGNLSLECHFSSLPSDAMTPVLLQAVADVDPGNLGPFTFDTRANAWQKGSGTGNNVLTLSPNVVAESDLQVTKIAPATAIREYNLTTDLAYTITIANLGPSHARNVILTDTLPPGTTFVTQTQLIGGPPFILTNTNTLVINRIDTLLAHQSATFHIEMNVSSTVDGGTILTNTAVGTTDSGDPTPGNNTASVKTTVYVRPDIQVTSVPTSSVFGQSVTLRARVVSGGSGTPLGSVQFGVDGANYGSPVSLSGGLANLPTSTLSVGSHTITATYSGDTNYLPVSGSAVVPQTVGQANTTTTITSDNPDSSVVGQSVTVNYTVTVNVPGSGAPAGNVTVGDGSVSCTGTVATGGCSLTFTTAGPKTLAATYAGNSNFSTSTSAGEPHTVNKADTTTTITSDNPDSSVVGQPVTVTYTITVDAPGSGTPTGNVTVSDGTVSCTDTVAAGQCLLTFTITGTKTLTATYAGNSNFNSSTSTSVSHTVNKADTTTTITSDTPDPSQVSQPVTVTYTVTVNAPGSGTPTGNVMVSDGNVSCTDTVAVGQCVLTLTITGTSTLVATYAGNSNFNPSTSTGVSHTVMQNTTTTITSDSPDPSVVGQSVRVDFEVTASGAGTPTGSVTVSDGTVSCTDSNLASGAGHCSLTFTTAGNKTLVATYSGDSSFNPSTSAGEPHTVNKADTTTRITSDSPDPSVVGEPVVVQYNVEVTGSGSGTPTGNVTVSDGTVSCTGTVAAGQCSMTFTTFGSKTLVATYSGDGNFNSSTSPNRSHTVDPADTTTTITSDNPDPSVVGQPVTVNYNVTVDAPGSGTPTGNVTVSDGTVSCTGTVAAGQCSLTFTTVGSKTLTAKYLGDSNFNSSTSPNRSHTVDPADTTTTITSDNPDPSVVGQSVTVNYNVTVNAPGSGTPTGNVTVSDGTVSCTGTVAAGQCSLTFTTAGNKTLVATYAGDSNFNSSTSAGEPHTANPADTTTTITSDNPDPSVVGQSVTVNYNVTVNTPGSGTPTGNVTVSDGTVSCTGTVAAGQCSLTFTTAGNKTLVATYAGDSNFNSSTSAGEPHTVNPADTTTTITSDNPDPSPVNTPVTVRYTVAVTAPGAGTPTGNVTVSDGTVNCTGTVAAGQCLLTLTITGTRTLVATYAGSSNFNLSTSTGESHTVQ